MASIDCCSRHYQMKCDVRMKIFGDDVRRKYKEEGRYVILEVLHVGKTNIIFGKIRGCTKSGFGIRDPWIGTVCLRPLLFFWSQTPIQHCPLQNNSAVVNVAG